MPAQEQLSTSQEQFDASCGNSEQYPLCLVQRPQLYQLHRRAEHVEYLQENESLLFSRGSSSRAVRLLQSAEGEAGTGG